MKTLTKLLLLGAGLAVIGAATVVSGVMPIAASSGHFAVTEWFLHFAMKRSVKTHSMGIEPPDIDDPRLVLMGAGHYEGGCRPCHGAPGKTPPRIPMAMTPPPPDLVGGLGDYDAADLFYIVRHGVKFTAMPAWPALEREDEVWAVVAFLRRMQELDESGYDALTMAADHGDSGAPDVVRRQCARCHGERGLGRGRGAFPKLAGQREAYLAASLDAYAKRERSSGIMEPIAANLTARQVKRAAAWYAARKRSGERLGAPKRDPRADAGRKIAEVGIPERRIPSCNDCHDAKEASPVYPRLAGQYPAYLASQLELFAKSIRGGSEYAEVMRAANPHALRPGEVEAVTTYYGSIGTNDSARTPDRANE